MLFPLIRNKARHSRRIDHVRTIMNNIKVDLSHIESLVKEVNGLLAELYRKESEGNEQIDVRAEINAVESIGENLYKLCRAK